MDQKDRILDFIFALLKTPLCGDESRRIHTSPAELIKLKKLQLEKLEKFIKKHKLTVISTVRPDSKPESAVIEFGQTDDLELIFDCFEKSRKFHNLKSNKNVSLVIGWDENITVQYEGEAFELAGEEAEKYKNAYWEKNPDAKKWKDAEGIRFFKVVPKWLRYSDLNQQPWEVFEISL